jgi:hypothetical protein
MRRIFFCINMRKTRLILKPIQEIIDSEISNISNVFLRRSLLSSFAKEKDSLCTIEESFKKLTSKCQEKESIKYFFQSWSKTNHSAASVSGLASRITLSINDQLNHQKQLGLYKVCTSLQRITDEDLGAFGGALHSDLFYRMATELCGDDGWLLKKFCLKPAQEFKDWTDQQRLREQNLINGLLTTLVHEIYTYGEVEFIYPLYQKWFLAHMGGTTERAQEVLAWVTVHTGNTEINHFKHAVNAIQTFCEVTNIYFSEETGERIFTEYLRRKAAVMAECSLYLG